jgi:iron complex transport system ATP-binding protein
MIQLKNITSIKKGKTILDDVSLEISTGEHWVFLGRNGAGKTTLINFLYGYHWPTSGEITVFGQKYGENPLRPIQEKIGILEYSHQASLIQTNLTVLEILITGIHKTIGIYREIAKDQVALAQANLQDVCLDHKAEIKPSLRSSILITHRIEEIPEFYSHICLFKNGKNIASGSIEEVLTVPNLMELYDLKKEEIEKWVKLS